MEKICRPNGFYSLDIHLCSVHREGGGNKVDTYFMAPDGSQFRSKWKIVEHMESSGHYSQADIDWVRGSITTPKPDTVTQPRERPDKLKREWKDDPKTVPEGWKAGLHILPNLKKKKRCLEQKIYN